MYGPVISLVRNNDQLYVCAIGGVLATASYPCDLDTTFIACLMSDHFSPEAKNDIMNEIVTLINKDGIIQTYFDTTRP